MTPRLLNSHPRRLTLVAVAAIAAIATTAASSQATSTGDHNSGAGHVLNVTARDDAFDLSTHTLAAGLIQVRFRNTGAEAHQVVLAELHPGQSEASYLDALRQQGPGAANALVDFVGGANAIVPGSYQQTYQILDAGHYLTLCFLPGPDGTPHVAMGMIDSFDVTGHDDADNDRDNIPRHVAGTITAINFGYQLPTTIDGDATYKFVNGTATDTHELGIVSLLPGKTVADIKAWYASGSVTPPPFIPAGGGGALSPNRFQWVHLNLTPGNYAALCNVPDDMPPYMPHAAMGMITGFTVPDR